MKKNDKKGIKPLTSKQMLQVKGGYREVRGTVAATIAVRWDEISIRFQEDDNGSRFDHPGNDKKARSGVNSIIE